MFPLHAKCVTFDAGYRTEQKKAREELELGRVYTVRSMTVDRSSSTLEFYEVEGKWNTVFFDAAEVGEVYGSGVAPTLSFEEDDESVRRGPEPSGEYLLPWS